MADLAKVCTSYSASPDTILWYSGWLLIVLGMLCQIYEEPHRRVVDGYLPFSLGDHVGSYLLGHGKAVFFDVAFCKMEKKNIIMIFNSDLCKSRL